MSQYLSSAGARCTWIGAIRFIGSLGHGLIMGGVVNFNSSRVFRVVRLAKMASVARSEVKPKFLSVFTREFPILEGGGFGA